MRLFQFYLKIIAFYHFYSTQATHWQQLKIITFDYFLKRNMRKASQDQNTQIIRISIINDHDRWCLRLGLHRLSFFFCKPAERVDRLIVLYVGRTTLSGVNAIDMHLFPSPPYLIMSPAYSNVRAQSSPICHDIR